MNTEETTLCEQLTILALYSIAFYIVAGSLTLGIALIAIHFMKG